MFITSFIANNYLVLNILFRKSLLDFQLSYIIFNCHHCSNICWVVTSVDGESNKANKGIIIIVYSKLVTKAHHLST